MSARHAAAVVPAALGALLCAPAGAEAAAVHDLAELQRATTVRAAPSRAARRVTTVSATRPITGVRTVLPVIAHRTTGGATWLRVRLPGRPNGRTGWIRRLGTTGGETSWRVLVRTAARRVVVTRRGSVVRSFSAIVGKPSTPTPHGIFFVEESVQMLPGSAGAPFALALSARSTVLQQFAGGPGQIAIHGLGGVGGTPGTAVSHGCVRLTDRAIRWLAERIAPGTPVEITR